LNGSAHACSDAEAKEPGLTLDAEHDAQSVSDDAAHDDDGVLSIEIGGKTVGARLEEAIAAGYVVRRPDGKFALPAAPVPALPGLNNDGVFERNCTFLNAFMFEHIYGRQAVPMACSNCYKVKVTSASMRQMVAVHEISEGFACGSKSQAEVDRQETEALYATYFYLLGLDKARAVYKKLRGRIDADPKLGPKVKMVIKRGCTNYERALGPSDRYTFDPQLTRIERYFRARFAAPDRETLGRKHLNTMYLLALLRIAYRIGDQTYKDFTGGKDLFPPTLTYDPDEPAAAAGAAASD
jgi:hypothetical protein